ncbi:DNA repair protein RAD51 homolog 4 isoform X4 [Alligator sinensis]|uniref:DNA repair protein RAD51 homolog 4 isoform X4 n=1 Tax=Alligator sinensis TaxID=38654 RepID=A0A3Q0GW38_ALLSI|nr:DNA repair protein RAD51 homolog 4 isoform X4 [Alligator sinensis]
MVMLQAGLCPGLTAEMIQLLKASGIRTVVDLISSDLEEVAQKCSLSYKLGYAAGLWPVHWGGDGAYGSTRQWEDTGGFTASRLLQLVQSRTEEEEEQVEALQRIQVAHVFDIYKMLAALQELQHCMSQQVVCSVGPVKLLVVDSVSAVVCPLFGGRQSEGLALMMQLARELKTLAREFGLATVVTNHVTRDSSSGHLKPALGRSWSFVPSTRVLLERSQGALGKASTQRIASLTKSPRQPTGIKVELDIGGHGALEERPGASGEEL